MSRARRSSNVSTIGGSAPAARPFDFADVHRDFARLVHGIAVAVVGPGDAEDAAQDAFLAIHRGLEGVRDREALPAWLSRVARNACLDFVRRQRRRPPIEGSDVEQIPAERPASGGGELARRVLDLVRSLPEAYRETLVLRLVEGLDGPEIAELTGMTPGSVRVNLCRGMAMLRPLLEKEGWP